MNTKRILLASCCLFSAWGITPVPTHAQDFEVVQQRLGQIVAEGELTLEQANVMFHALHEFTRHQQHEESAHDHDHAEHREHRHVGELLEHFERLGMDEESVDRVQHYLNESGIHDEQLQRSMTAILRLVQMMRSSDKVFEMPEPMLRHFREELRLSNEQVAKVVGVAKRLSNPAGAAAQSQTHQAETQKKIAEWVESLGQPLIDAVDRGELSKENAWEKWESIKGNQIRPKTDAAIKNGDLSRAQVEELWKMIEHEEAKLRE